jgi:hypothetical protein
MLTLRELTGGRRMRLIWWYVAAVVEETERRNGEEEFSAELIGFEEALEKLTFETDRDAVRKAVEVVESSLPRS